MSLPQLINQQRFTDALVEGIDIPQVSDTELFDFGNRLIDWINITDNEYWACWNPEEKNSIVMDIRTCEIMHLKLETSRLIFLKPDSGAAEDLPKEFGNAAIGIILFCMIENEEIEELALDDIPKDDKVHTSPETESKPPPDFEWI
jgi:hypothetical protein